MANGCGEELVIESDEAHFLFLCGFLCVELKALPHLNVNTVLASGVYNRNGGEVPDKKNVMGMCVKKTH